MTPKTILLCLCVVAVCAAAIFWFSPSTPVAPVAVPEKTETRAPVTVSAPPSSTDHPTRSNQTASDTRPVPPTEPEDKATALLAKMAQGLASTDSETRDFALTNLLPALVVLDPTVAGQFAATNTIEDMRETVLQNVAKLLAAQDPTNAITWAGALPQHDERETALTDVCRKLAEADPAEAIRLREGFLADYQSFDALEDLAMNWAEKDLLATLAWIASLPKDVRRDQLIGRVAYIQSLTSPKEAADLVAGGMTPGEAQIEAAVSVLHQWGRQDLAAATRWAESFPEGPLRTRALTELSGIANEQRQAAGN